ncbi:hypothetical protein ANN_18365 [Periplaneta americana]|uniref:Histone-lysine N-methyltransferase SETMAR n=1 Tax=Periplaneta americana TaxID=6978 RepID=A0ABQ8SNJ6_PERAM|nr:hypothetical protein ANN_18365 [Periplaneta americana]
MMFFTCMVMSREMVGVLFMTISGDEFLKNIITVDENWVHHFDPENKWSSMHSATKDHLHPKSLRLCHQYCETIKKTESTNSKVRPDMKQPLLQHENARPHTSAMTTEHIQRLGFAVVDHPPYSPDLAPSGFHLFPKLKEHLRGHLFDSDDAVQTDVRLWFRHQSETFYSDYFKKLVTPRKKCTHR